MAAGKSRKTKPRKTRKIKTPDPVDVLVGAQVAIYRRWRGLSPRDLAGAVGVTLLQMQRYEAGASRMGASTLYKISRVLEFSVLMFFKPLDGVVREGDVLLSPDEIRLLRLFRALDPAERAAAMGAFNAESCAPDNKI